MAICINCDGICFGTYSITPSADGICISGAFSHQGTELRPPQNSGTISGYTSGGRTPAGVYLNTIDKYPFTSDTNATDVGDMFQGRAFLAGQSSSTHGYATGGDSPTDQSTIDKFPFTSDTNGTDVGELTLARGSLAGTSSITHGYAAAGTTGLERCLIDKFPFAVDANSTDIGNLICRRYALAGTASHTHGYMSSGQPNARDVIEKFPFSVDAPSTDVGELVLQPVSPARSNAGQNSGEHGYASGGGFSTAQSEAIQKWPFAVDAPSSDVGELTSARGCTAGTSSAGFGYTTIGENDQTTIDKFPFAVDAPATDVGDITQSRWAVSGQQV